MLRAELVRRGVEVPETDVTGPSMSKLIISVIWQAEEKMSFLRLYDELLKGLNRERRGDAESNATHEEVETRLSATSGSEPGNSKNAERQGSEAHPPRSMEGISKSSLFPI